MSNTFASDQARIDAGRVFSSAYPFEPYNGGEGIELACTTESTSEALVGEGDIACITNPDNFAAYVRFWSTALTVTSRNKCILPLTELLYTIPAGATHVSGITRSGSARLQITRGRAGN